MRDEWTNRSDLSDLDNTDDMEGMEDELFRGARPRVFVTNVQEPDEGRTFVWSPMGMFERMTGEDDRGDVEFSPLGMGSDSELREWLNQMGEGVDITEIDDEYANLVEDEFEEQAPLYPEGPELSNQ